MTSDQMNQLGNWNPQLLRECRGRLKPRSVVATIALSLIGQTLLVLAVWAVPSYRSEPQRWLNLFRSLTWTLPYILFIAGSYSIVGDLTQEERRGTLGFIRLSPRPSHNILLGKLLGAPILPYLGIALAVPLHLLAAVVAGVPLGLVLSFYVLTLAGAVFLFSGAMLFALVGGAAASRGLQRSPAAISFATLTLIFFAPMYLQWNIFTTWSQFGDVLGEAKELAEGLQWLYIPLAQDLFTAHSFTLINLGIGLIFIWKMLMRRFQNPKATIVSKQQSYALVAYLEVLVWGFLLHGNTNDFSEDQLGTVGMGAFQYILFLALIFALSPQRQMLLDWVRYERHPGGILQDLIWAEKSPAPVAIAINLVIANALLIPWVILTSSSQAVDAGILMLFVLAGTISLYAVLVQRILAAKIRNPIVWAGATVALLIVVPPLLLGMLRLPPDEAPFLWTFFGFPWTSFFDDPVRTGVLNGILLQWIVLAGLVLNLRQHLKKLAASASNPTV